MIIIKTEKEIEIMRKGGKILASVLKKLTDEVRIGITSEYLEKVACDLIKKAGGRPSFKGFKTMLETKAFPTALCVSINDEIVHAPSLPSRELRAGDIVGIDVGMEYPSGNKISGYYTDMAVTVPVGKLSKEARRLIEITKKSLILGIKMIKPEHTLSDIGQAIQICAEKEGFSVVRDLVGHGVGTAIHEDPQIPNYEIKGSDIDNIILKKGMTIAIEPMINIGGHEIKNMPDGFTIATADGSLSAHFEHTIAVTESGCEILTKL